ncbi:IS21 family transposase [Gluconacetobacter sacchari]|uniref:IS21 family transposase n=1 Tax=Gluconacetobacter sacchari TaxID=92759 RepID=A0A7W4IHB7_9PROT|nr:IS21 family transposase [Gluconacetobacter sacchari]
MSQRAIGRSLGLSQPVVSDYLFRARRAGLGWPLPDEVDDTELERRLYPPLSGLPSSERPAPDWTCVHRELRRPNVTLALLWEEYRTGAPDGFGYSWFCESYRAWANRLNPTLRQVHRAGERLFVDFAGSTVGVTDGATGKERPAQIFVAVLGASSFTYARAVWSQTVPDWIRCHVEALAWFGGVPQLLVSDNLKAGVIRACFHEPSVNRTYAEMAMHYGSAILPARPYKPRDKAKVEVGVQVVQRWILARLRNQRFFSLAELNAAIAVLLDRLNDRIMRGLGTTRRALFEQFDRPALLPLPATRYVYAEWRRVRAGLDYHVQLDGHVYSVPYALARQATPDERAGEDPAADHRRLGARAADRRATARSPGDRRRPRQPGLAADHQPVARQSLARRHRRHDARGCHHRPDRPSGPSPRPQRGEPAQTAGDHRWLD